MKLSRRSALLGLTTAFTLPGASVAFAAAATDARFVVVLLRGGLDGLHAVPPYGDADLLTWRPELAVPRPGTADGGLDLDGFFALHPALAGLHDMFKSRDLLVLHAVGNPTPERSHFIAQDCLECGADHRLDSGWLNRAATMLPQIKGGTENALAVGVALPLLLRGSAPVASYLPAGGGKPNADFYARMLALHARDPVTGQALREALHDRDFAAATLSEDPKDPQRYSFPALCGAAGKLLAAPAGPRLAALEIAGWDTHAGQKQRLEGPLKALDAGLVALRDGLGAAWKQTAVLVVTEFGRTVRANGTGGTDHGTGTMAFLAGGAVAGGRMLVDWPGLAQPRLFENRDLAATRDVRALAKGVLAAQFGFTAARLATVFPDSEKVAPAGGLLRG